LVVTFLFVNLDAHSAASLTLSATGISLDTIWRLCELSVSDLGLSSLTTENSSILHSRLILIQAREDQEALINRVSLALYENNQSLRPISASVLPMGFENGISTQSFHIPAKSF
jgi:hypothetical protein